MSVNSPITLLKADLLRQRVINCRTFIVKYCFPRGSMIRFIVWLRIMQMVKKFRLTKILLSPFVYLIFRHYEFKYGIHANTNIKIGGGLHIVHGDGVHLNCDRIGSNFTVYQGVTLGILNDKRPIVGDNVTIYPGAVIVGGVTLHDGCTVGALSYVSHDVAAGEVVKGVR